MYELERQVIEFDKGVAIITLHPDEDPQAPDDADCEPDFKRAERGGDLNSMLNKEFGYDGAHKAYMAMAAGEVYKTKDGDWYYGITEYRHSGCALALCGDPKASCWPDQQWDVIPLSGWIKISKQLRKDWGIFGRPGVEEKAKANAEGYLKAWDTYLNGGVIGYQVRFHERGPDFPVVEEDSCWGYYEQDEAMTEAKESAEFIARHLGWREVK